VAGAARDVTDVSLYPLGTAEIRLAGTRVATLGPGDCFGETDPTAAEPHSHSVVAQSQLRTRDQSYGCEALCEPMHGSGPLPFRAP